MTGPSDPRWTVDDYGLNWDWGDYCLDLDGPGGIGIPEAAFDALVADVRKARKWDEAAAGPYEFTCERGHHITSDTPLRSCPAVLPFGPDGPLPDSAPCGGDVLYRLIPADLLTGDPDDT